MPKPTMTNVAVFTISGAASSGNLLKVERTSTLVTTVASTPRPEAAEGARQEDCGSKRQKRRLVMDERNEGDANEIGKTGGDKRETIAEQHRALRKFRPVLRIVRCLVVQRGISAPEPSLND